ncbi:MAG: transposase, partial [Candidatus Omnitrophica bacterium]|nr:transposase [Candidatus Omnitrophota bacterium]
FYNELKGYKESPTQKEQNRLDENFETIFTQKTDFETLNLALQHLHKNKSELLLVLDRPEIPLHNNLSENDIREYVKRGYPLKAGQPAKSGNCADRRKLFIAGLLPNSEISEPELLGLGSNLGQYGLGKV